MPEAAANKPSPPPVPDGTLDRIVEALSRSRKYLSAEKQRKLDELWDLDTFLAFVVLLALWAGFQLTPIAWIADIALTVYGSYQIGSTLLGLINATREAGNATTDQALETAAQHLAAAMTDTVVDAITAILGAALFGRLRAVLRPLRNKLFPKGTRLVEAELARPKVEEPTGRPKLSDYAVGGATALAVRDGAVVVGSMGLLPWAAAAAALLGLVLVIAGLASTSSSSRRSAYAS